jgi:hypothetical protein
VKGRSKIVGYVLIAGILFLTIGILFKLLHFANAFPILFSGVFFISAAGMISFIIMKQRRK